MKALNQKKAFLCVAAAMLCFVCAAQKIKVACVGDSVTYGLTIEDRENDSYPAQLQRLLGDGYEVGNFGKSGATLLNKGHRPYNQQDEYKAALEFAADIVVIHLGLNDTDPRNWPSYRDEFVQDYISLIEDFREANSDCKIWICRLSPINNHHPRFKSGTRDWYWQIQPAIETIAEAAGCKLIDLQEGLYPRPDLLPDAIHPTAEGAAIIAKTVFSSLTGNYGGLKMPGIYTDHMVLQRDKPLRIAGTANAGERVTVKFAGQKRTALTGDNGKWEVTLDPLAASFKPAVLKVSANSGKLEFEDVLVGDVWLCSGQSNMQFRLKMSVKEEVEEQLAYAASSPSIRLFNMKGRWPTDDIVWPKNVLDSLNRLEYYSAGPWTLCDERTAAEFSAIGFSFGRMLSDSLKVPIGLINNAVGGAPAEAWIDRKTLEFGLPDILYDWTKNDLIQRWVRERSAKNVSASDKRFQRHPYEPCYLFEAGNLPLDRFPIKGVIWYQGESNAHNVEAHEVLFPLLTESWRAYWQEDLPFYFVQLSSIDRPSWPWFRDSQRRLEENVPNCWMAVSSDLGDSLDVHPRRKQAIGERLARQALNHTYGRDIVSSGPVFKEAEFDGRNVILSFDNAEGLKTSDGGPLITFEVAHYEGLYKPAHAEIVGDKIKVWSDEIDEPRYVRYGWQPFTRANLVNGEGLPASTFRAEIGQEAAE